MNPYEPFNLLLGHDTQKYADARSVESLVNLRLSNVKLVEKFGDDNSRRLEQRRRDADEERWAAQKANQDLASSTLQVAPNSDALAIRDGPPSIPVDPALQLDQSIVARDQGS